MYNDFAIGFLSLLFHRISGNEAQKATDKKQTQ